MKSSASHISIRHAACLTIAMFIANPPVFAGMDCNPKPTPPGGGAERGSREEVLSTQFLSEMTAYGQTLAGIKATGRASQDVAVKIPKTTKTSTLAATGTKP